MNGHAFANTNAFRFNVELRDLVASGIIREDIALYAMKILTGKASFDTTWPVPRPWSDDARTQAKQYAWIHQFKDDPVYKDLQEETPFDSLLERYK